MPYAGRQKRGKYSSVRGQRKTSKEAHAGKTATGLVRAATADETAFMGAGRL